MQRVETNFSAGLLLGLFYVIPLRDFGVEVPAVVIDSLPFFLQLGEQLLHSGEVQVFEVSEADDDVGYLHAGVVDVVLHVDALACGFEQAHEGVSQDGVAQVADVRGLVGIDAGVLHQGVQITLCFGTGVGSDGFGGCRAVQLAVDVARSGHGEAGEAFERHQLGDKFGRDRARGFLQTTGKLKGNWQRVLAHGQVGRLLNRYVWEFDLILIVENRAQALTKQSLLFAIHFSGRF